MKKNNQLNQFLYFTYILFILLLIGFSVQTFVLNNVVHSFESNDTAFVYLLNFVITSVFFRVLIYVNEKNAAMFGYYFMASSFIKLTIYSLLLHPVMMSDKTSLREFFIYFAPYSISLFTEIYSLIKVLDKE